MRSIRASEFRAKCLAILDEVNQTGEPVAILKRGRVVARLLPPTPSPGQFPQESLRGTVKIKGDILEPVLPPDAWEA
ncbi:MAG: type II toxin-antitoxin system Phd/YefM family antitoxin [Thermoanaerobaculia bacterium]